MDREFYLKFINACAHDRQHLETVKELIEGQLKKPATVMVQGKSDTDLPIITAHLEQESGIVRPQGGMATIPAAFGDKAEIMLIPVFVYETDKIEERYLDYEAAHITALLDRAGEYAQYKKYFLNPPAPDAKYSEKLDYLKHVARRIMIHDQTAFFLLHPDKAKETVRSLILYQLGERLSWYLDKIEIDKEKAVDNLCEFLDEFAANDPFYKDFDVSNYFRQSLIAMSFF
ncbi:hypothetical protein KAI46_06885 [bacterium]|nr:hypothetical protein [bacterium]